MVQLGKGRAGIFVIMSVLSRPSELTLLFLPVAS